MIDQVLDSKWKKKLPMKRLNMSWSGESITYINSLANKNLIKIKIKSGGSIRFLADLSLSKCKVRFNWLSTFELLCGF